MNQPLATSDIQRSITAATRPADRLILALAAVHAARVSAIRALRLTDLDLGDRRLTIAGRTRPLDELTYQTLVEWLNYRRVQWPATANPHVIINRKTALTTAPTSRPWIATAFHGQIATLERLRRDRQLEEALTHGPDPLHLAVVFGLAPKTAIRYAESARQLLTAEMKGAPQIGRRIRSRPRSRAR
ncbi:hypothetical protein [Actinosynnema sp. ALI-1.44]|uniref:hypothetical protein n=1 Tax=Actinosynnema sp. ALI-1.44 TaxID=1933779 RepID=UPI00097BDC29|nr:hypothetical protein [Actinosynnema sp. ALI-1.44]